MLEHANAFRVTDRLQHANIPPRTSRKPLSQIYFRDDMRNEQENKTNPDSARFRSIF